MFIIVSTLVKQHVPPVEQACCGALSSSRFLVGVLTLVSVLYQPLFVFLSFSFWSLYCLFFFDLQLVARMAQLFR
jgi:hypothetical protein